MKFKKFDHQSFQSEVPSQSWADQSVILSVIMESDPDHVI